MDKNDLEPAIETVTLQIGGMDCTCNADLLARKLDALTGIRSHEITPVTGQARVRLTIPRSSVSRRSSGLSQKQE